MAFLTPPNKVGVISATLATPPGSPTTGDLYLLYTATPSGAWAGQLGNFARWSGSAWEFVAPYQDTLVWANDTSKIYHHNGSVWTLASGADTGPTGTAGGDLSGTYPNPTVSKIFGRNIQNITIEETFGDNFDDNSLDAGKWIVYEQNSGEVYELNSKLETSAVAGVSRAGIVSVAALDFTGKYVKIRLAAIDDVNAVIQFALFTGSTVNDSIQMWDGYPQFGFVQGGNYNNAAAGMYFGYKPNTGSADMGSAVAGLNVAGTWFRLRHDSGSGNVFWETSTDDTSWTVRRTVAVSSIPGFNIIQARICVLGGGDNGGGGCYTHFDDLVSDVPLADSLVNGQVLAWNSTTERFEPTSPASGGSAGGDLSGSYPNPTVVKIQGRSIGSGAPNTSDALVWNGTNWAPAPMVSDPAMVGDVIGTASDNTVVKLRGRTVKDYPITNFWERDFSTFDSGEWDISDMPAGTTIDNIGNEFNINLPTSGYSYAFHTTKSNFSFNFTDKFIQIYAKTTGASSGLTPEGHWGVWKDSNNYISIWTDLWWSTVTARVRILGVNTDVTINASNYQTCFWRIEHDSVANTAKFYTGTIADPSTLVLRTTISTTGLDLTGMKMFMGTDWSNLVHLLEYDTLTSSIPISDPLADGVTMVWKTATQQWEAESISGTAGSRGNVAVTTGSLANLVEETGTIALGKSAMILKVTASVPCRIRLYSTTAFRLADAGRSIGVEPTGEHGLLLECIPVSGNLELHLSPPANVYNGDLAVSADMYYAIQNMNGSTSAVTVTFSRILLES